MSQFKGRNSLRSNMLKRALKSYIIPPVLKKYQVISLSALWDDDQPEENRIWLKRKMSDKKNGRKRKRNEDESDSDFDDNEAAEESKDYPGIAFWIAFDWPEYGVSAFEEIILKEFLSGGFCLSSCKVIKSRGLFTTLSEI